MAKASTLLKQARAWVGIKEGSAQHREIVTLYNSYLPHPRGYALKMTDSWCAATISALAIKCNATNIIPVECSCQQMIALCKKRGIWVENDAHTPKKGDIIFYDWQDSGKGDNTGWSDHVGIVETVTAGAIIVIEGNYSDSVKRREIKVNAKTIRGFAVPKYEKESFSLPKPATPEKEDVKLDVDGDWGKDTTTKTQTVLGTKVDGIVSNQPISCKQYLENAYETSWEFKKEGYKAGSSMVRAIQKLVGAKQDGHCGKKTVTAMQKFLMKKGFYTGKIDGYMGEKTVKAWQMYINSRL